MTRSGRPPHRRRGGWLSSVKEHKPTPWWQWALALPVLAAFAAAFVVFLWTSMFNPEKVGAQSTLVPVLSHGVDSAQPGGKTAYLSVKVNGRDVKIFVSTEQASRVKDGETIEVFYKLHAWGVDVSRWIPKADALPSSRPPQTSRAPPPVARPSPATPSSEPAATQPPPAAHR